MARLRPEQVGAIAGREYEALVRVLAGEVERVVEAAGSMAGSSSEGGGRCEVTIIRAGDSNNRLRYSAAVLQAAVPMFEGASAFCDHPGMMDEGRAGGRSLRDLVGVYEGVRWDESQGAVRGTLRMYPGGEWMMPMMRQMIADREAGRKHPNVGISADMMVVKTPVIEQTMGGWGRLLGYEVKQIAKVNSADVVFSPAAGGRLERMMEATSLHGGGEELVCEKCNMDPCGCAGAEGAREGTPALGTGETRARSAGDPNSGGTGAGARTAAPSEIARELEAVRAGRLELCGTLLEQRLAAANLPQTATEWLRGRFKGRIFESAELGAEIESVRGMLGGVVAGGVVRGMGPTGGGLRIEGGRNSLERVQLAVDRLFGLPLPDAVSDVPRFSGIREAYLTITGDTGFTGRYDWERSVFGVAREADEVTTSIMANIVANSMTKKLVRDYQAQPKWWLPIVTRTSIRDMKTQDRIKLYDFAVFPTVNENAAYVNLAWDDIKETYTPAKKGSTVVITLETIINDDIRGVSRIPSKLAAAAAVTINEFVSGLFTANSGNGSTMVSDSTAVFDAAGHQSNKGTAALSSANLKTAMITLAKMTNTASKRIGVIGRHLLVPPDLIYTAQVIAGSASEPGTANNDMNPLNGKLNVIPVPNWTDANNWYLLADPSQIESIELGFLNGREEPELLVQDSPLAGSVFTNDAITYKVRWIFGGAWLDYRGAYGGIVA